MQGTGSKEQGSGLRHQGLFPDPCSLLYPLTDIPENDSTASPRTG